MPQEMCLISLDWARPVVRVTIVGACVQLVWTGLGPVVPALPAGPPVCPPCSLLPARLSRMTIFKLGKLSIRWRELRTLRSPLLVTGPPLTGPPPWLAMASKLMRELVLLRSM